MTAPHDDYWDDLGVVWRAVDPDVSAIAPRIEACVRRQSVQIVATLMVGLPLSAIGVSLGVLTIWRGWTAGSVHFVTRGLAIVTIAGLMGLAMLSLLRVRAGRAVAVSDMLELSIARAQRVVIGIRGNGCVHGRCRHGVGGDRHQNSRQRPPADVTNRRPRVARPERSRVVRVGTQRTGSTRAVAGGEARPTRWS